jgi:hypothetical protein
MLSGLVHRYKVSCCLPVDGQQHVTAELMRKLLDSSFTDCIVAALAVSRVSDGLFLSGGKIEMVHAMQVN